MKRREYLLIAIEFFGKNQNLMMWFKIHTLLNGHIALLITNQFPLNSLFTFAKFLLFFWRKTLFLTKKNQAKNILEEKQKEIFRDIHKKYDKIENDSRPEFAVEQKNLLFEDLECERESIQYVVIKNTGPVICEFNFVEGTTFNILTKLKPWVRIIFIFFQKLIKICSFSPFFIKICSFFSFFSKINQILFIFFD